MTAPAPTLRLYRPDAFLQRFQAHVLEIRTTNGQTGVILDQTAFYPTAGGQPNDTGKLADWLVVDVVEQADGGILHVLKGPADLVASAPAPAPNSIIEGQIDWPRRFDHMQQHSGQHVLSQAFVVVAGLETIAVHIGPDECTLDLPSKTIDPEVITRVEDEANRLIYENRPILIYEVGFDALGQVPLRKPPKKSENGLVRIVEVKDYDWSACGGTHVRGTAEIGLIKIIKVEKRGNESRVTFRCGRRALLDYRRLNADVNALAEGFTVARYEMIQAVQRLRDEAKASRKALEDAQQQLLVVEATERLSAAQPNANGIKLIVQAYGDASRDMNQLRALAKKLTATDNVVALLGSAGAKSALCFARSANLKSVDVSALLKAALAQLAPGGAKGGGSPDLAQGGGPEASLDTLNEVLAQASVKL